MRRASFGLWWNGQPSITRTWREQCELERREACRNRPVAEFTDPGWSIYAFVMEPLQKWYIGKYGRFFSVGTTGYGKIDSYRGSGRVWLELRDAYPNFTTQWHILESGFGDDWIERERYWISRAKNYLGPECVNIAPGGEGPTLEQRRRALERTKALRASQPNARTIDGIEYASAVEPLVLPDGSVLGGLVRSPRQRILDALRLAPNEVTDRNSWLTLGTIAKAYGDDPEMREAWVEWCGRWVPPPGKKQDDPSEQWDSFRPERCTAGIGLFWHILDGRPHPNNGD